MIRYFTEVSPAPQFTMARHRSLKTFNRLCVETFGAHKGLKQDEVMLLDWPAVTQFTLESGNEKSNEVVVNRSAELTKFLQGILINFKKHTVASS